MKNVLSFTSFLVTGLFLCKDLVALASISYPIHAQVFPKVQADTVKRKDLFEANSCSNHIKIKEVFTIGDGSTEVIEMENGLFYIHNKGVLDAKSGKLYNLKTQIGRISLYELLGDSIICLRVKGEQHIFNLRTDYQYYRKPWKLNALALNSVETYKFTLVPIFDNDTTILITDLQSGKVIRRISGPGIFSQNFRKRGEIFYAANKYLYGVNLQKGGIENTIPISNELSSNVLRINEILLHWDRGSGLKAYDVKSDKLIWEYASNINIDINLLANGSRVYFSDGHIKALDVATGELKWVDSARELLVDNSNITSLAGYLLTGYYMDSDAVIAMIDAETGSVTCNGSDLPNETGYNRYTFYEFSDGKFVYAKDDGGYERKLVRFELLTTKD